MCPRIWKLLLLLVLGLLAGGASAETDVSLFKSFAGNVNFIGTQATMRTKEDESKGKGASCKALKDDKDLHLVLNDLPKSATVVSAHLYWAGSGDSPDYSVTLDDNGLTAADGRKYAASKVANGNTNSYFGGAVDVTMQVIAKRNGNYKVSALTVDASDQYCKVDGVAGGAALLVIYADPAETYRLLNLYEGFKHMLNSSVELSMTNFQIPPLTAATTGRIGHISWHGDDTSGSEHLKFNNVEMTDALNPSGNQFNSESNINNDQKSYGIDFDAYEVASPVIKAGDTKATSTYQTGQDLVLLNAQIIAVPQLAPADLAIAMAANNDLVLGEAAGYTITVTNKGPNVETGPVTVAFTLSAGLDNVSASGANWVCTNSGQLTCTHPGPLAIAASLPAITLGATVNATGTLTATASVSGVMFDNDTSNNSASVSGVVSESEAPYAFTNAACVDGMAFGSAQQTCSKVLGKLTAGSTQAIYITALSAGIPTRRSATADTPITLQFALSCINPGTHANTAASYGVALPVCTANGVDPSAWSGPLIVTIPAGKTSVGVDFQYKDVGQVKLNLSTSTNRVVSSSAFVSTPVLQLLSLAQGSKSWQGNVAEAAAMVLTSGLEFNMMVGATTLGGEQLPNFGRENIPVSLAVPALASGTTALQNMPALGGAFTDRTGSRAAGPFSWAEAGIIKLSPIMQHGSESDAVYLGETVSTLPFYLRFIPGRFETSGTAPFICVKNMGCADGTGAAYSAQPFKVRVTAKNAAGGITKNYQGDFARKVFLFAYDAAGGDALNPAGGTLSENEVMASSFANGESTKDVVYTLPNPFKDEAPQARNWTVPTSIYLRATESAGDGVTSKLTAGSEEGGIRIVSGRLNVPNAHGSERLPLPIALRAQYWTGTHWEPSSTDAVSSVNASTAHEGFSNCISLPCATLKFRQDGLQVLAAGARSIVLGAPGAAGQLDLLVNQVEWLPSTRGRIRFGVYRSPVIYIREVY